MPVVPWQGAPCPGALGAVVPGSAMQNVLGHLVPTQHLAVVQEPSWPRGATSGAPLSPASSRPQQPSPTLRARAGSGAAGGLRGILPWREPPAAPGDPPARPPPGCHPGPLIPRSSRSPGECPLWAPRATAGPRWCPHPRARWLLGGSRGVRGAAGVPVRVPTPSPDSYCRSPGGARRP